MEIYEVAVTEFAISELAVTVPVNLGLSIGAFKSKLSQLHYVLNTSPLCGESLGDSVLFVVGNDVLEKAEGIIVIESIVTDRLVASAT